MLFFTYLTENEFEQWNFFMPMLIYGIWYFFITNTSLLVFNICISRIDILYPIDRKFRFFITTKRLIGFSWNICEHNNWFDNKSKSDPYREKENFLWTYTGKYSVLGIWRSAIILFSKKTLFQAKFLAPLTCHCYGTSSFSIT